MAIVPVHHAARRSTRATAWRAWRAILLAGVAPLAGCYTTATVTTTPAPGSTVLLDLTDRGRVQLGDQIGPSAARIGGIVDSPSDSAWMLRVSEVRYLNGQSNRWSGERLTVPANLVSAAQLRQFSRSRTTAVGVGIVAAIVTVFARTSFLGRTDGERQTPPPTGGNS